MGRVALARCAEFGIGLVIVTALIAAYCWNRSREVEMDGQDGSEVSERLRLHAA